MKNSMMSVSEAAKKIENGARLVIAGSEHSLSRLPRGCWIGGTSVYFLTANGGVCDTENLFVTEFDAAIDARPRLVHSADLPKLMEQRFDHGVTIILIPAFSVAHSKFAMEGAGYEAIFEQPLMGWITGVHLNEISTAKPKIFNGMSGESFEDGAMLLHVSLPESIGAELDIINLFQQDNKSDVISFETDGFSCKTAKVNGQKTEFAEYIRKHNIDTKLPLVADYAGAMINVSIRCIDMETGGVEFYAPVLRGTEYRFAESPGEYATAFAERVGTSSGNVASCNCILNYIYGDLEGKLTGGYVGPATFGEIAYILLNQTLVKLALKSS